MKKFLIAVSVALLIATAFAQDERPQAYWMTAAFANDMDAIMLPECPILKDEVAYCLRLSLGVSWLKMEFDQLVTRYTDLEWGRPWSERSDDFFARMLVKTSDPEGVFAVFLFPEPGESYSAIGMIQEMQGDD